MANRFMSLLLWRKTTILGCGTRFTNRATRPEVLADAGRSEVSANVADEPQDDALAAMESRSINTQVDPTKVFSLT